MKKIKNKRPRRILWNRKRNHPSIVFAESKDKKTSLGITHSKKTHNNKNQPLRKSPNPNDPRPQYIVKRIQRERHSQYKPTKEKMHLSRKDETKVTHLFAKLLRKKQRNNKPRRGRNRNKKE